MADELVGKQEVVIKNLGEVFKTDPMVSGGAILGMGVSALDSWTRLHWSISTPNRTYLRRFESFDRESALDYAHSG